MTQPEGTTEAARLFRVEITPIPGLRDARGAGILRGIHSLGIGNVDAVAIADLYFLAGDLDAADVELLASRLLLDPVVEEARWQALPDLRPVVPSGAWTVEVTLLPGVTDSVAESLLEGARLIGVSGLREASTGRRYTISGAVGEAEVRRIASSLLANEVIQAFAVNEPAPFTPSPTLRRDGRPQRAHPVDARAHPGSGLTETIPLTAATDQQLMAISRARRLSLDVAEMAAIQTYYRREGREPTDVELETLAQTWSEHCVHKTFKAEIEYEEREAGQSANRPARRTRIDGLLKTYIRGATEQAAKPWVRSAFVDNAGIVAFDERFDLAFKVETHNHPSALEPFGGANTGVGGVVRDVIGVSARPIANTDVLCFGPQDLPFDQLPAGVLHPRRVQEGVVAGIEDYGNKMGIPTVNGAILYNPGYTANPLVFCGCLGILPHGSHRTKPQAGDLVVVLGGRTGRDGLRGATFSSMEMDHQTGQIAGSAVQIGHPIHEKQVLEAILQARDEGLYNAITDCGAGGLSSAVGEMGEELGAQVHLERVPLKYPGLRPWEIWLSEAQERMVLAVPPAHWSRLEAICRGLEVEATILGSFTGSGRLDIRYGGQTVGELACDFLHNGIPRRRLQAAWSAPQLATVRNQRPMADLTEALLALLAAPQTRSKEDVVRQYDHEVQGGTVVKPFVGIRNHGPGDAAVIAPLDALRRAGDRPGKPGDPGPGGRGLALSVGVNPHVGAVDPYLMAWACVDEAIRNVVAVGADPDQVSLLDNFSWGNPNLPDRLGALVRCCQGCFAAAVAFAAPFVSGKDSLNNEYTGADGQKHAIPGTVVISALGIVPDVARTVTMDLKAAGNLVYAVGLTKGEMAGSAFARLNPLPQTGEESPDSLPLTGRPRGALGNHPGARRPEGTEGAAQRGALEWGIPPQPPENPLDLYRALHRAIAGGLVLACHDCSEGGLAVAAAEMALAGGLGLTLRLADVPGAAGLVGDAAIAFGESMGRFLVEIAPGDAAAFERILADLPTAAVGRVGAEPTLRVEGLAGNAVIETNLAMIEHAWRGHLDEA